VPFIYYYKTIPLDLHGVKCFVQGQGGNNFSLGDRTNKPSQTTISHHQNTILQEEKKTDQFMHAKGESTFPGRTVNDYSVY